MELVVLKGRGGQRRKAYTVEDKEKQAAAFLDAVRCLRNKDTQYWLAEAVGANIRKIALEFSEANPTRKAGWSKALLAGTLSREVGGRTMAGLTRRAPKGMGQPRAMRKKDMPPGYIWVKGHKTADGRRVPGYAVPA